MIINFFLHSSVWLSQKLENQSTHNFLVLTNAKEIFFPRIFNYFGYKHAKKH